MADINSVKADAQQLGANPADNTTRAKLHQDFSDYLSSLGTTDKAKAESVSHELAGAGVIPDVMVAGYDPKTEIIAALDEKHNRAELLNLDGQTIGGAVTGNDDLWNLAGSVYKDRNRIAQDTQISGDASRKSAVSALVDDIREINPTIRNGKLHELLDQKSELLRVPSENMRLLLKVDRLTTPAGSAPDVQISDSDIDKVFACKDKLLQSGAISAQELTELQQVKQVIAGKGPIDLVKLSPEAEDALFAVPPVQVKQETSPQAPDANVTPTPKAQPSALPPATDQPVVPSPTPSPTPKAS